MSATSTRFCRRWTIHRTDRFAGPPIVAVGGGTGMSCLLSGLKAYSGRITAVVTVTDNGGSSGRLRKEFDMVPPGDIRDCLLALSEGEPLLARLLDYRFEESDLAGHSFGNLFITALTRVTGSFDRGVRELNRLLEVRGQVLPATGNKVSLIAHHPDGSKSTGEVEISASSKPIESVEMRPRVGAVAEDIVGAITAARLMIFGPGSLFTSVIPNLLVDGIREAILANPCEKICVANIMTQPGETTGLDLAAHVAALEAHAGERFLTAVVVHGGEIAPALLERYAQEGAFPVGGLEALRGSGLRVVERELIELREDSIRHQPDLLASCIVEEFLHDGRGKPA
ncbi:MAG: uridine diphosphate-N-acetylglucosamine-binding protein YvcK [Planctomycetota bacterium]